MIANSEALADRPLHNVIGVIGVIHHVNAGDDRTVGYAGRRASTIALRTASANS